MNKALYCGIDLHSSNAVYFISDEQGKGLFKKRLPNSLPVVLDALEPVRQRLKLVAVEPTYHWYWLVDGLMDHDYPVRLVHPTAVEQYNGIKLANDFTDAAFQARLKPEYAFLLTIPGVGVILGLTITLETGDISRFPRVGDYTSYGRCVRALCQSNGKTKGQNNSKNGNKYLSWAFVEAVHHALGCCPEARKFYDRKLSKRNGALATKALAAKWSKAAYYIMKRQEAFDLKRGFGGLNDAAADRVKGLVRTHEA